VNSRQSRLAVSRELERLRIEKLNGKSGSLVSNGNGNGHQAENLARVGSTEGK
jgi:hypothetical protein